MRSGKKVAYKAHQHEERETWIQRAYNPALFVSGATVRADVFRYYASGRSATRTPA